MKIRTMNRPVILFILFLAFCVVAMTAQAAPLAPKISSITPTQTTAGTFDLVIKGSNFDPGAVEQIYWQADGHYVGQSSGQIVTSTKIIAKEYMTGATPGKYIVRVKNSDGTLSNGKTLTVKAPAVPAIYSITPSETTAGTFTLTITGSNFNSETVDQIYWSDGRYVGQGKVQSVTSTKIIVTESMTGATPGKYTVKVKNSAGLSDGKTLTIKAPVGEFSKPTTSMNPVKSLKMSDAGVDFIANHEGCPMENGLVVMYNDPAGHCTIGYGHLIHLGNIDGRPSEKPYANGITVAQARDLFKSDLAKYEGYVRSYVKVPLTQYQYDALVSFTYNVGPGNLKSSDLLTELNKGNYDAVPDEMKLWNKVTDPKTGKKIVSKGLVNRRTDEANLFKTGNY